MTIVATLLVANAHRSQPVTGLFLSGTVVALGVLSYIDVAEHRLPNKITLSMAGVSAATVLFAGLVQSKLMTSLGAIALGIGFGVVLLLLQFGLGDVKLALSIGTIAGWLGTPAIVATMFVASASGALAAAALMIVHRRRSLSFGFGPFLALGSVAGMLAAAG
ncbi:MAG: prepilin peptidase [Acidimicrobiales bacterium]